MIDRLQAVSPEQRPGIISELYEKNLAFFKDEYPDVHRFIQENTCPYEITITGDFLEIVNSATGEKSTQNVSLDSFCRFLGDWTHDQWLDFLEVYFYGNEKYPLHYNALCSFMDGLNARFPQYRQRVDSRQVDLKDLDDKKEKKYSPPVIFLGIFHGLHIDYYLSRTELSRMLLVEPEAERFEVSCYFLDYQAIKKRLKKLYLSIGPEPMTESFKSFMNFDCVTPQVWTRVLPGYPGIMNSSFIEAIRIQQKSAVSLFYPVDIEIAGLENTKRNLEERVPVLSGRPELSADARIAVVASGPSLKNDLKWLKKNQGKIIIFAVHSSVSVLTSAGITPDFQFSMETMAMEECTGGHTLGLLSEIPRVVYCRVDSSWIADRSKTFLVSEKSKAQLVNFSRKLSHTHPSTTNMAVSLACYLQPAEILLFGCDFGFKDSGNTYVKGTWRDNLDPGDKRKELTLHDLDRMEVVPNFRSSGTMYSNSFLIQTRMSVERCLQKQNLTVVNVSDGAAIAGTDAKRSASLKLNSYKNKRYDCSRIERSFAPAEEGCNFVKFTTAGEVLLQSYLGHVRETLSLEPFSLTAFSEALDLVLDKKLGTFSFDPHDWRMDIYSRLLNDLLRYWYCVMMFTRSPEESDLVYREGLKLLSGSIDHLFWPETE